MELLPPTTNLLRSHRVSHRHGFARKHCIICFISKPNFKLIISLPQPKYLIHISYLYLVFLQNGLSHHRSIAICRPPHVVANIFPQLRCAISSCSCVACTIRYTLSSTLVLRPSITIESLQAIWAKCSHRQICFKPMNSALKSFFAALFIGTSLGTDIKRMSHAKVAPEGLKPQECERNVGRSKAPIPYIPEKDVI